jgi:hypothetical protein
MSDPQQRRTGDGADPTPFPGRVDRERLDELIALATETMSLDFKQSCDLSEPAGKYEFETRKQAGEST